MSARPWPDNFDKFNPIYMMAFSGARGNIKQIRQLALVCAASCPTRKGDHRPPHQGELQAGPVGVGVLHLTHGARKGLPTPRCAPPTSGYLTRRLVDVAQDVIIREIDCETTDGVPYPLHNEKGDVDDNLIGRCPLEDVKESTATWCCAAGAYIERAGAAARHDRAGVDGGHPHGHDLPCRARRVPEVLAVNSRHEPPCQHRHGRGIAARPSGAWAPSSPCARSTPAARRRRGHHPRSSPVSRSCSRRASPRASPKLAEISKCCRSRATSRRRRLSPSTTSRATSASMVSAPRQMLPGVTTVRGARGPLQRPSAPAVRVHLLRLTDLNTTPLRYIVSQV